MKTIPLGITVTEIATGLKGYLTHLQVELDQRQFYAFCPIGLHSETGKPLKSHWIVAERIKQPVKWIEIDMPVDILGTIVTNKASGFKGMATALILHVNGCIHVQLQARGALKAGEIAPACDFDIRECEGPAIKALSQKNLSESKRVKPSPIPIEPYSPGNQ